VLLLIGRFLVVMLLILFLIVLTLLPPTMIPLILLLLSPLNLFLDVIIAQRAVLRIQDLRILNLQILARSPVAWALNDTVYDVYRRAVFAKFDIVVSAF
jgi:hypothetical protein